MDDLKTNDLETTGEYLRTSSTQDRWGRLCLGPEDRSLFHVTRMIDDSRIRVQTGREEQTNIPFFFPLLFFLHVIFTYLYRRRRAELSSIEHRRK